jgi:hypothetical protein
MLSPFWASEVSQKLLSLTKNLLSQAAAAITAAG